MSNSTTIAVALIIAFLVFVTVKATPNGDSRLLVYLGALGLGPYKDQLASTAGGGSGSNSGSGSKLDDAKNAADTAKKGVAVFKSFSELAHQFSGGGGSTSGGPETDAFNGENQPVIV